MKLLVRVTALLLFLVCIKEAGANFIFFRATRVSDLGSHQGSLEKAVRWSPQNPKYLWRLGRLLWEEYPKHPERELLKRAHEIFRSLTQRIPFYGKVWLYLAETELLLTKQSGKRLTDEGWQRIDAWMRQAKSLAPGNAWLFYRIGLHRLIYRDSIARERSLGFAELKRAAGIPPSSHLAGILNFLWQRYQDSRPLRYVVPRTYEGYDIFRIFCEKSNLWKLREEIVPKFSQLKKSEYDTLVRQGEGWYQRGSYYRAYFYFQKAFWIDPDLSLAKIGMMLSMDKFGGKMIWNDKEILKEILEDEDRLEEIRHVLPEVQPIIMDLDNAYLKGLYAFHQRDWNQALQWLQQESGQGKYQRRYLAEVYRQTGQREKARQILLPVLL